MRMKELLEEGGEVCDGPNLVRDVVNPHQLYIQDKIRGDLIEFR